MRQRGIGLVEIGVILAVIAAGIAGIVFVLNRAEARGYERGATAVKLEWEAANRKAEADRDARSIAVAQALLAEEKRRLAAENLARAHHEKWKEAVRASDRRNVSLGICPEPGAPAPVRPFLASGSDGAGGAAGQDPGVGDVVAVHPGPALTWEFVRQFDTAWTGGDGKPVSHLAAWEAGPAIAGAASPYGLADVRDAQGENAKRCSEDRRELAGLMAELEAAADAWDARSR